VNHVANDGVLNFAVVKVDADFVTDLILVSLSGGRIYRWQVVE
jgi:hypothetical protein